MIHFVSGKGGVGKSTVAAALAWKLSENGRKTLLVELGSRSHFRHVFSVEVGPHPVELNTHLSVVRWEGEDCLREYLKHFIKIDRVVQLFFDNRVMRSLVQAAPALRELAILGQLTSSIRKVGPRLPFEDIVVDSYSTGHFRALWRAPIGIAEAIPFGPMGEQSRSILRAIKDANHARYYVVLLPEELPTTEGIELARSVKAELNQTPVLVLNKTLQCPLNLQELAHFQGHPFAEYLSVILERQATMLERAKASGFPLETWPWLFTEQVGERIRELSQLEEA